MVALQQDEQSVDWLTGKALKQRAQLAINGQWSEAPLLPLLKQLSVQKKIPLFVDRRVDPSASVNIRAVDVTWEQLLIDIGNPGGYGFCKIEHLYYFGPQATADSLPDNYQKLKSWISKNRKTATVNWRKPGTTNLPLLGQPREMLQLLARENKLQVYGLDEIPFDLWPASEFSEQPMLLKTALLVVGFEKWIAISKSGKKMKVVDYVYPDVAKFSIGMLGNSKSVAAQLTTKYPHLKIESSSKATVKISGPTHGLHSAICDAVSFQKVIKGAATESTFTAELKGSRGSILATIANQMSVKFEFSQKDGSILEQHVEFDVVDATAAEIAQNALEGTGLQFQLDSTRLRVFK